MSTSSSLRNAAFIAVFLTLSGTGIYNMNILLRQLGINDKFDDMVKQGHLNRPHQHITIPTSYTGFKPLDGVLTLLVAAFAHGPLRLDEDAFWQQLHFLLSFFPIVAIWTIEGYRIRNHRSIVSYTSIWALFYQTLGAAFMMPLQYICYISTARNKGSLQTARAVPVNVARSLVGALLLGYLIPTVVLFLPGITRTYKLQHIAFWQFTPLYVNLLIEIFSRSMGSSKATQKQKPVPSSDSSCLATVYLLCILTSFITHATTIIGVLSGNPEEVSLVSVFIPSRSRLMMSISQDVHHIFQWDWIITAISSLIWAVYTILELRDEQKKAGISSQTLRIVMMMVFVTIVAGPGGGLTAVWWWRERALVELELVGQRKAIKTR